MDEELLQCGVGVELLSAVTSGLFSLVELANDALRVSDGWSCVDGVESALLSLALSDEMLFALL